MEREEREERQKTYQGVKVYEGNQRFEEASRDISSYIAGTKTGTL